MCIEELGESEFSGQILEILNHAIVHSTALFDYAPRTPEMMREWFDSKKKGNYPVLGVVTDNRDLMGFASYGPFRAWPAYKYTAELSVYVHQGHRRKGVADFLLKAIKQRAEKQGYHVLVAGIEAQNQASINLHMKHGFTASGVLPQVGFKFNRWLDLAFYQFILSSPEKPVDG